MRFQSGADTDYQSNEFQRADCAPRSTSGDGSVTISDVQQGLRYQSGADTAQLSSGPAAPTLMSPPVDAYGSNQSKTNALTAAPPSAPTIRAVGGSNYAGQSVTVQIRVDNSDGTITGFGFSLNYNKTLLTLTGASLGSDVPPSGPLGQTPLLQVTPRTDPTNSNNGQIGIGILLADGTCFLPATTNIS